MVGKAACVCVAVVRRQRRDKTALNPVGFAPRLRKSLVDYPRTRAFPSTKSRGQWRIGCASSRVQRVGCLK